MTFTITITIPQIIMFIVTFLISFIVSFIKRRKTIKGIKDYNSLINLINSIRLSRRY